MKRKVFTDGNGSKHIFVEGLGEFSPKQDHDSLVEEVERLRGERDELIEDVKQELLKSTSAIFRPHLEGVFAVIEGRISRGEKIKGEDNA